jgi:hypothetical protein
LHQRHDRLLDGRLDGLGTDATAYLLVARPKAADIQALTRNTAFARMGGAGSRQRAQAGGGAVLADGAVTHTTGPR